MNNSIDTIITVRNLIKKIERKIKLTIGRNKALWIEFLNDCKAWLKANVAEAVETVSRVFEVGCTYSFGWIGDADMKTEIKVLKRTKSFVTFICRGEEKRAKVSLYSDVEQISPMGKYSMSPICRASKKVF